VSVCLCVCVCLGETGLGKSTVVNSLFLTDLYANRVIPDVAGISHLSSSPIIHRHDNVVYKPQHEFGVLSITCLINLCYEHDVCLSVCLFTLIYKNVGGLRSYSVTTSGNCT